MIEDNFVPCDDCVNPSGCLTRCRIEEYHQENSDVAAQRGETPQQLWGENE